MSKYEEHNERYDSEYDEKYPGEEAAVRVRAVDREVMQGRAAAVRGSHAQHTRCKGVVHLQPTLIHC